MKNLYAVPAPQPIVTVILPDGAGEVKGRMLQIWKPDPLITHFAVEVPTWERWACAVGEKTSSGIAPATTSMWAPWEAVILDQTAEERLVEIVYGSVKEAVS